MPKFAFTVRSGQVIGANVREVESHPDGDSWAHVSSV